MDVPTPFFNWANFLISEKMLNVFRGVSSTLRNSNTKLIFQSTKLPRHKRDLSTEPSLGTLSDLYDEILTEFPSNR